MGDVELAESYWHEVVLPYVQPNESVEVYLREQLDWAEEGANVLAWDVPLGKFTLDPIHRYRDAALSLDYVCGGQEQEEHLGVDCLISDFLMHAVYYARRQRIVLGHQVGLRLERLLGLGKHVRFCGFGQNVYVTQRVVDGMLHPSLSRDLAIIHGASLL